MLDLKFVRANSDRVREMLSQRGYEADIAGLLAADEKRRAIMHEVEQLRHELNAFSKRIGEAKRRGEDAGDEMGRMRIVSQQIRELDREIEVLSEDVTAALLDLPNVPHESVAVGADSSANPVVRHWGEPADFSFPPRSHVELGEELDILDFQRGSKIAGARFVLYKGLGARLERALINFMLDLHVREHQYVEVLPPFMVNPESMMGTGQLPKFAEDLFKVEGFDYYLVPTAEVPVTNIHRGEVLSAEDLPLKYAAYTPCFRSEAGSYGKDVRGIIRQHQFNKVELVKLTTPETSYDELESLTRDAEEVLRRLGLHYRVVSLCTGDLGFAASKTYDLEVWLAGVGEYKEISSCSNFEDFQTRRMSIRYKGGSVKKPVLVHSLNGSGLAIGRTVVALLESFQQEDGSVVIPPALVPYMDGVDRISPSPR